MKFIGGCRHGADVPKWACDGRSTYKVDMPASGSGDPESCEYRLAIWRHADGTSEFFFCSRALHSDAEIDAAARPLLSVHPEAAASRWVDLFGKRES